MQFLKFGKLGSEKQYTYFTYMNIFVVVHPLNKLVFCMSALFIYPPDLSFFFLWKPSVVELSTFLADCYPDGPKWVIARSCYQ